MKKLIIVLFFLHLVCFAGATPTPTRTPTLTVYAVVSPSTSIKFVFLTYGEGSNFIKSFNPPLTSHFYGISLTVTAFTLTIDPNNTTYKVNIYLDGSTQVTAMFQGYGIELPQTALSTNGIVFTGETQASTPLEAINIIRSRKENK